MTGEIGLPAHAMARTILRTDEATRVPLPLRPDDHERISQAETMTPDDILTPGRADPLSLEETVELFRRKVTDAQQDTRTAFAGSENVSEAVRPKLTLDMGHSKIARLPETVVDLIKVEVERLSLSHNQIWHIPLRFAECSQLRYLNIRTNVFREIPRGVRLYLCVIFTLLTLNPSCTNYHSWRFST